MAECQTCGGRGSVATEGTVPTMDGPVSVWGAAAEICPTCNGSGRDESYSGPSLTGAAVGGVLALPFKAVGWLVGSVAGVGIILVPLLVGAFFAVAPMAVFWAGAEGTLRSIMETLPLGDAVAETRREDGSPGLIALLALIPLIGYTVGTGFLRRSMMRQQRRGEVAGPLVTALTWFRAVVVFAWLGLIPVLVAIAAGRDLEKGGLSDGDSIFTSFWAWAFALVVWVLIVRWDANWAREKVEAKAEVAAQPA